MQEEEEEDEDVDFSAKESGTHSQK